jgi:hypothetical protein
VGSCFVVDSHPAKRRDRGDGAGGGAGNRRCDFSAQEGILLAPPGQLLPYFVYLGRLATLTQRTNKETETWKDVAPAGRFATGSPVRLLSLVGDDVALDEWVGQPVAAHARKRYAAGRAKAPSERPFEMRLNNRSLLEPQDPCQ